MNDERRAGNQSHDEDRHYAEAIVRTVSQPLLVLDADLTVETGNPAFYTTFSSHPHETEGRRIYEIGNGQWDIPRLRELLEQVLPERQEVRDYRVDHEFRDIGRRTMLLSAQRMQRAERPDRILVSIDDITERERAQAQLEAQMEFAEKVIDASREALLVLSTDLRVQQANETFYDSFKVSRAQVEGRLIYDLGNGQWAIPRLRELLENVLPKNDVFDDFEVEHDFEEIGHRIMVLNARRIDHLQLILLAIEDVTERRQGRAALAESEERFRSLVGAVAQATWEADADGTVVEDSPTWRAYTGQTLEEWRGIGWVNAVHPEDRDHALRQWQEAVAAGRVFDAEFRLCGPDGGWHWTNVRASPIRDSAGVICKWVGMNIDIDERKRLQEDTHRYRLLVEQSNDFIAMCDLDGRVIFLNASGKHLVGVPEDLKTEGTSLADLFRPDLRPRVTTDILPTVAAGNDWTGETSFRRLDGTGSLPVWCDAFPIRDRDGTVSALATVTRDLSERKAAEEALRESEQRFRKAMEIETVGVIFWDHEIRISECNSAFLRMTGYTAQEVAGLDWRDLTPAEFVAASENAVAELRDHGLATPYVKQYRRKDGSRWWGLFAPRRLTETETVEFVLDITERVQAEDQRDLLLAELNHRVKNMFAVIRAIAMQGNGERTAAEFRDIFLGRLDALVRTHNLVFEEEWRSVSLEELAQNALEPYATASGHSIRIEGPPVKVAPKRALSLSLVLHELATNAAKYGALSTVQGEVRLSWATAVGEAEPIVHLEWTESGGPQVQAPPKSGFGTRLISRIFDYELGGEAALDFVAEGVRLRAVFRAT